MSETAFWANISAVAVLVIVGIVLMILGNVRSKISPRGETERNLPAYLWGGALTAVGTVYGVIVLMSLGN